MRRLSQLDIATSTLSESNHITFEDCRLLDASINQAAANWSQPLPRGVGRRAAKISTDLVKVGESQCYAIVRLGYDLAGQKFGNAFPLAIDENYADGFWQQLYPKDNPPLVSAVDGGDSLERRILAEEQPRTEGWMDLWKQTPIEAATKRKWMRRFFIALGIVAIPFLIGVAYLLIWFAQGLSWLLTPEIAYSYKDFLEKANSVSWETHIAEMAGHKVNLHGRYLKRRGTILTVELDGLKKMAEVELQEASSIQLPLDAAENRPYYVVAKGVAAIDGSNSSTLRINNGQVVDVFEERPQGWGAAPK